MVHDPFCPVRVFHHPGGSSELDCQCDLIRRVIQRTEMEDVGDVIRADRRRTAEAWQFGAWTRITKKVQDRDVIGTAQVVTNWLWERVDG